MSRLKQSFSCGATPTEDRRKMFFFEKKNQKTFVFRCSNIRAMAGTLPRAPEIKVFCFFSSEKKNLLTSLGRLGGLCLRGDANQMR
jgi:hypothetical protein